MKLSLSIPRCLRYQAIRVKQLKMRVLWLALLGIGPSLASGQGDWSLSFDFVPDQLAVYDVLENPNGSYMLTVVTHTSNFSPGSPLTRSWIVSVGAGGEWVGANELEIGGNKAVFVPQLVDHPVHGLLAVAMKWFHPALDDFGVAYFSLDDEGATVQSQEHTIGTGSERTTFRNVILDPSGDLFIPGSLATQQGGLPNRVLLMRLQADGSSVSTSVQGTGSGLRIGHHALVQDELTLVSIEGGGSIGPFGLAKFVRFDQDFEVAGGFPMASLGGSGELVVPDSVLKDSMYMIALAGDTLLVSGRYSPISQGMRAALVRFGPDGEFAGTFLPRGEFFQDGLPSVQGHDMMPDGNVLFAMIENFFPGPPNPELGTQPSKIRVYRMDTLLNVQCEFLLDGFEDNAYYFLTRIKATSDGGALLLGSRRDLNTLEQPRGWIMKLGPDQCYTGLAEHQGTQASIFPNPGHEGFTVLINGPALRGGRLELSNAIGSQVLVVGFDGNMTSVDTAILANGLYVYRITDRTGRPLASGRWVKE